MSQLALGQRRTSSDYKLNVFPMNLEDFSESLYFKKINQNLLEPFHPMGSFTKDLFDKTYQKQVKKSFCIYKTEAGGVATCHHRIKKGKLSSGDHKCLTLSLH